MEERSGHDTPSNQSEMTFDLQSLFYQTRASWIRFERSGSEEDLDTNIAHAETMVNACSYDHPERVTLIRCLAFSLYSRFQRLGGIEDLEKAITLYRDALNLLPDGHPLIPSSLKDLITLLIDRIKLSAETDDINELITLHTSSQGEARCACSLDNLANYLSTRSGPGRSGVKYVEGSIKLHRVVLNLRPEGHFLRSTTLNNLADSLHTSYKYSGKTEDLEEAIRLNRDALRGFAEGHPHRSTSMSNLANCLITCFRQSSKSQDLEESIRLHTAALALRPEGHPDRHDSLNSLAISLSVRFEHKGVMTDLEESIRLHRDALVLLPERHPQRSNSLNNLANNLKYVFDHIGSVEALKESIDLHRAALDLRSEGHPQRHRSLNNLAISLRSYFENNGRFEHLEESIVLNRSALNLFVEGDPDRPASLNNLARALSDRFHYMGRIEDLEESIRMHRAALELCPEGQSFRASSLQGLANSLMKRFEHSGRVEDLEESIALHRATLELRREDHPLHPHSLSNLASSVKTKYERNGDGKIEDLEESIRLLRSVLHFFPDGHPFHCHALNNLANSLIVHFQHTGKISDLEETVSLHRAALELLPDGSPYRANSLNNLANSLETLFKFGGSSDNISESIQLLRDALDLRPEGHPHRTSTLSDLARCFFTQFRKEGRMADLEESIQCLIRAATHSFSSASACLKAAQLWASLARSYSHDSALEAYRMVMSLLQHVLITRPSLSAQHGLLTSDDWHQSPAPDAASYAVERGHLAQAIELLEEGRALLWSQMRGLRSPIGRLEEEDETLARRFKDCSRCLGKLITSSDPHCYDDSEAVGRNISAQTESQVQRRVDEMLVQIRRLSEEQATIVDEIRQIPGFESFLKSEPFETLREAAAEGPVIVINHSKFRSDAIIVLSDATDPCVCVPLEQTLYDDAAQVHKELLDIRREFGVDSDEYDGILRRVLRWLWDRIVCKVVQRLKELGINEGSRIWWCPTSVLTAFPFHAAGPYRDANGNTKYLLDDYISSYTPTLKSLINARSGVECDSHRMLYIGDTTLPSTKRECLAIHRHRRIDKRLIDDQASPDAVMKALRKVEWVHFACHGHLDKEPFRSSFKLFGGGLTLLDIVKARLPNAQFAFLSACHTAEQAPNASLDEVLHLAAAMQFCGFRSVVGTMWQLFDPDGPPLSECVYAYLMSGLQEGEMRFKRGAAAVRHAALTLRKRTEYIEGGIAEIKAERWVNLVHIGA